MTATNALEDLTTQFSEILQRLFSGILNPPKEKEDPMTTITLKTAAPEANQPPAKKFSRVEVKFQGEQIVLPEGMNYDQGVDWILKMKEEAQKRVSINEVIEANPVEGAYAFKQVLDEKFGFTNMVNTGWFNERPPTMLGLEIGFQKTAQVPWGRFTLPALGDGYLQTSVSVKDDEYVFLITGEIRQLHKELVMDIANATRQKTKDNSIYKGQAVYLKFANLDEDGDLKEFNINDQPRFMDTGAFDAAQLVFSKETQDIVDTTILTPVRKTQLCREMKIPLKRGILLEGPYGVGKTLTANMTAKECVDNGWTFLYLQNPHALARAIRFASKYQPACIFLEDVDRVFSGERSDEMNDVLNVLDGIDTKTAEVMVIVTTNHIERLNKASLRPGRLDSVISVRAPDAAAIERLINNYARGKLASGAQLKRVAEKLAAASTIPAVVREVVERAKLGALRHARTGMDVIINEDDLMVATTSMLQHLELLKEDPKDKRHDMERFGDALGSHIVRSVNSFSAISGGQFHEVKNGKHQEKGL